MAGDHPDVVKRMTEMMNKFDRDLKANARPAGKAKAKKEA